MEQLSADSVTLQLYTGWKTYKGKLSQELASRSNGLYTLISPCGKGDDHGQTGKGRETEGTGLLPFRGNRPGIPGCPPEGILRHLQRGAFHFGNYRDKRFEERIV